MRLATFNIKHASLGSLEAIARALREAGAEAVALQEVGRGTHRSGRVDQAGALAGLVVVEL